MGSWYQQGGFAGPLQVSSFFVPNNPQMSLYKYNLRTLYNYGTTGRNLYKYDLAAEPQKILSLETEFSSGSHRIHFDSYKFNLALTQISLNIYDCYR